MFEEFERLENEPLSLHGTMKIGGAAKWILFPKNIKEIKRIFKICKKNHIKTFVLGCGSNVLFSDKGYDGAIINLKHFKSLKILHNGCIKVGAGINLFNLNLKLQKLGLSGLEFCYGIPATLGGFLVMNGGCFGHEICEFVEKVYVFNGKKVVALKNKACAFSYRSSNLKNFVVLGAKLHLKHGKSEKIAQNLQFYLNKKRSCQPCDKPSLGSVFKRSKDASGKAIFPAKIIDELGLKGFCVGGAQISTLHAGFIVNNGGASSQDVLELIEFLEDRLKSLGVEAEREIVVL